MMTLDFHLDLGPHAGFIIAAYAVVLVVVIAMIVWVRQDYRAQRRHLAELEEKGAVRRSQRSAPPRSSGIAGEAAP